MEKVKDLQLLDFFYDDWSLAIEGIIINEEEEKWLLNEVGTKKSCVYIVTGQQMNSYYRLTGDNAYRDDLHICVVTHIKKGFIALTIGARWFTDIVDNNERRERIKIIMQEMRKYKYDEYIMYELYNLVIGCFNLLWKRYVENPKIIENKDMIINFIENNQYYFGKNNINI